MSTGLKKHQPEIRFSGNMVTPDEIDQFTVYTVVCPAVDNDAFATAVGTSTQAKALGFASGSRYLDYPRNLRVVISCASSSTKGGTLAVTGKDQFGNAISESLAVTVAADGGTTEGTKVFMEITAGTFTFGTANAGNGTCEVGGGIVGTTALFGLPVKLGVAADIRRYNWTANNISVPVGTIGADQYDLTLHAVKAWKTMAGTEAFQVWVKSTYNAEYDANNLTTA